MGQVLITRICLTQPWKNVEYLVYWKKKTYTFRVLSVTGAYVDYHGEAWRTV